jgi:acyl-CoA-binding protein
MVAQTADFKKAIEDSRKLKAKPSDDELLQVRENIKHEREGSHMD